MFTAWDTCVTNINSGSKTLPLTRSPSTAAPLLTFYRVDLFACVFTSHNWNTLLYPVLVNFMCQLDWAVRCPDIWSNIILGKQTNKQNPNIIWVCLWRCFWMRWTFESEDGVKQIALPREGEPRPTQWRPEQNKSLREQSLLLPACLHLRLKGFSVFGHELKHGLFQVSKRPSLGLELTPSAILSLQLADCRS